MTFMPKPKKFTTPPDNENKERTFNNDKADVFYEDKDNKIKKSRNI